MSTYRAHGCFFMSKKIRSAVAASLLGVTLMLDGACAQLLAETSTTTPILTIAEVPTSFTINLSVQDAATGQSLPNMDFGKLSQDNSALVPERQLKVLASVNAAGMPYDLSQNSSSLVRQQGMEEISNDALVVRPVYEESVNGGQNLPAGAKVAAVGTGSTVRNLYTDPTGQPRVISIYYSIAGENSQVAQSKPLSSDQRSGSYTGQVQFTLTSL